MSTQANSQEANKIIYVYDALCGWCYGFSPVIQKIAQEHAERFSVEVISGGMVTGDREGPIGEVASYIKWAYKDVEQRTGITFGTGFLNETLEKGEAYFTSVPPARALSVVKKMNPSFALSYASALQKLIYYDGVHPTNTHAFIELATSLGLDKERFKELLESPTSMQWAIEDFEEARNLGVSGYPTVFIELHGKLHLVARGYIDYELLDERLENIVIQTIKSY